MTSHRSIALTFAFALSTLVFAPIACKKSTPAGGSGSAAGTGATAGGAKRKTGRTALVALPASVKKPAAGKGNLFGRVLHAGKPLVDAEVKLCAGYNQFLGGCGGEVRRVRTDAKGHYLFANITPRRWAALLVRAPGARRYQYTRKGFIGTPKVYTVKVGETARGGTMNLTRDNLVVLFPRPALRTKPIPALRWQPYPAATHYRVSIRGAPKQPRRPTISASVKTTRFSPKKPLTPGRYLLTVKAYAKRARLAEHPEPIMFIVPDAKDAALAVTDAPPPSARKRVPLAKVAVFKPTAPAGAVQGRVLFDERPAAGITIKLCEAFSPYFGGCRGGKVRQAKTDARGVYLFKNIPAREYKGLLARVFKSTRYLYIRGAIIGGKTYAVRAGETLQPPPTRLYKSDLKILVPARRGKAKPRFTVKWAPYPGAAYYELTIAKSAHYKKLQVEATRFALDKLLMLGRYKLTVTAFNAFGSRLARSKKIAFAVVP